MKRKKPSKTLPAWLKAVPEGVHGSGTIQKRLWRLKSDFVRIRDFIAFGTCIATGTRINHWQDTQAGHFKGWTSCRGMFKFSEMNIHAQTPKSNAYPDKDTWKHYEAELVARYGQTFVDAIETSNKNYELPMPDTKVMAEIERTIKMLATMEIKPPYWERLTSLREAL